MLRRMARWNLSDGIGFELELANANTVEWSSEVSVLKKNAGNKKSSKEKMPENASDAN